MLLPVLLALVTHIQSPAPSVVYKQPQLAAGNGQVGLVFGGVFGGASGLYFSSSSDNGNTFARPIKVADVGALALGRHRGPRLSILKGALVVTAIAGKKVASGPHAHGLPHNGDLLVWRSVDKGATWKRAGVANDVPGAAREGLHAVAVKPDGTLFAAWLDLREKGTQLYGAASKDGGQTWSKNVRIYSSPDGTICQCCHPALSIDRDGSIYVMWRNAYRGGRDLHAASSKDGVRWETARKLGTGTWEISACPMDGGGFVVENGAVTSAWRRDQDVILSDSANKETRLGSGKDVALARGQKGFYTAWTKDGGIELMSPGNKSPKRVAEQGAFANLLALPDGFVLVAWETLKGIATQKIE